MKTKHQTTTHNGVAFYFRGCLSNDDSRQVVIGAGVKNKPDELGRKITYLGYSIDGKTIVDYHAERDNRSAYEIEEVFRSLLDGTYRGAKKVI